MTPNRDLTCDVLSMMQPSGSSSPPGVCTGLPVGVTISLSDANGLSHYDQLLTLPQRLALAVLAGDDGAALALADLVTETVNGDKTTSTGRLVAEAVRKEREEIATHLENAGRAADSVEHRHHGESLRAIAQFVRERNRP